jgi:hypothetical protein
MSTRIQIYTDENGLERSVLVPYREWIKLNAKLESMESKLNVFSGIRAGLKEVENARETGKKLQSLADFVNENRN